MADPAPTGTVVPAPQGGGSTEPQVPAGKMLVDVTEHQTWQRQREQLAGLTQFHGAASKRGFSKPDDFARYDKFDGVLKAKGMTMDQMVAILQDEKEATGEQPKGMDPASIEKFLSEKGYVTSKALDEREALIGARFSHKSAMESEQKLIEKYVEDLTGQEAGAFEKAQLKAMLAYNADQKRGLYPDGHPLSKEALAAHNEQSLGEIVAEIKKMKEAAKGDSLAAKGAAVNNGARGSVAGGGGSKQPAKPSDKDDDDAPIGSPAHKAKVERYAASLAAKRGQGPVSAAGG